MNDIHTVQQYAINMNTIKYIQNWIVSYVFMHILHKEANASGSVYVELTSRNARQLPRLASYSRRIELHTTSGRPLGRISKMIQR